jgi:hypothetical protein
MLRAVYVPKASGLKPLLHSIIDFYYHIWMSISIVGFNLPGIDAIANQRGGNVQAGSALLNFIVFLWKISLTVFLYFYIVTFRKTGTTVKLRAGVCLVCMVFASTPGFIHSRSNLIFWPTLFFSFFVSLTLFEMWRIESISTQSKYSLKYWCIVLICLLAITGSLLRATVQRLDMHPLSYNIIVHNFKMWVDKRAVIPSVRRVVLEKEFNRLEFDKYDFYGLYDEALRNGRYYPDNDYKTIFIPPVYFLSP